MKMTKSMIMTWIPPTTSTDIFWQCTFEYKLKLLDMFIQEKTDESYNAVKIDLYTRKRFWRDQAAVDEWIEFMQYIAKKYNGKTIVGEITDI